MPQGKKNPRRAVRREEKGSPIVPNTFLDQDFQKIQKDCLSRGQRFTDDRFPPDSSSIDPGKKLGLNLARIRWLRPSNITANPQLIVQGVSRFDYSQGSYLGNCWFLASVGALTFQRDIMDRIMPTDQSFDKDYVGMFLFRFWRFGKWIDVVIDDNLPTIDGELIFVHSKTSNEFWPALLEKAYAKVCGSYADMHAGCVAEALLDFTGGVHMFFNLKKPPTDLWSLMQRAVKAKGLMGCSTSQGDTSANTVLPNGIVQGHAYTVTGVYKIVCQGKPVRLVRVLNPWGQGEWTGDWSDKSVLWSKVSKEDEAKCHSLANDGEFWMSMEDFSKNYEDVDICCTSPDFLDGSSQCCWMTSTYNSSWDAGTTAGGCLNFKDSFWTNPQFRVKIEALDRTCASGDCPENILVSLMQIHEDRHRSRVSSYSIGFSVFVSKEGKFPATFFYRKRPVQDSGNYINSRQVMKFFMLQPGEYLIVPSTFTPNECGKFILSIYTKSESHKKE